MDSNYTVNEETKEKMCWGLIPEETSGGDQEDFYVFEVDDVRPTIGKRERFICNYDRISAVFVEVLDEIVDQYKGTFSVVMDHEGNHVKLTNVDEGTTWLRFWK